MLIDALPLIEAATELVGVGWGGGGIANDFSTANNPINAANTNAKHAPMTFFIL
jgi:hypothetical protein